MVELSETHEFLGCKFAEVTGASNLIVLRLSPLTVEKAEEDKSQTMTFQSLEAVKRYLEFLDQHTVVTDLT